MFLSRPVWVIPGRKPQRQVFSWRGSFSLGFLSSPALFQGSCMVFCSCKKIQTRPFLGAEILFFFSCMDRYILKSTWTKIIDLTCFLARLNVQEELLYCPRRWHPQMPTFYVKILLFPNSIVDLIHVWHDDRYGPKFYGVPSTCPVHDLKSGSWT